MVLWNLTSLNKLSLKTIQLFMHRREQKVLFKFKITFKKMLLKLNCYEKDV